MGTLQNSTSFLRYGGVVLLVVGIVGFIGLLNNVAVFSLDMGENVAHTGLGLVGIAAGYGVRNAQIHRLLTAVVAITAIIFGLLGFFLPSGGALSNGAFANPNFLGLANLENPADNLLHVFVFAWATWSLLGDGKAAELATASR